MPARRDRMWLTAIVAGAAAIRWIAWQRTAALFNDGPQFLYIAEAARAGDAAAVLGHPFHPLYSLLTAALAPVFGDLERAAVAISIASGAAAVGLFAALLRDLFGARIALVGAALLAVHPSAVDFSSDVQSEGLYTALFLAALVCLWRAIDGSRAGWAAAAGGASGLAYLVRPEGLGVLLLGFGAWSWLAWRRADWRGRAAALAAVALLGASLSVLPYVAGLRLETGRWTLTQKKSPVDFTGIGSRNPGPPRVGLDPDELERKLAGEASMPRASDPPPAPDPGVAGRAWAATRELAGAAASSLRFELLPLIALGLFGCRGRPGPRAAFIGAVAALYGATLWLLAFGAGYVSRRHALPPLIPMLGYAAVGVPLLGSGLLRAIRVKQPTGRAAMAVGLAVVALATLPRDLRERRPERLAERRAAEWLRVRDPEAGAVAASRLRIAYYAGAPFVPLPSLQSASMLGFLRSRGAGYVIVDEANVDEHQGLREAMAGGLRLLHRSEAGGRTAAVYEVLARGDAGVATGR